MLAALRAKLAGAAPPGSTIGGHRLSFYFEPTGAHTAQQNDSGIFVGILVGPDTLDVADTSPLSNLFLDWMYWERFSQHVGANGDMGRESFTRQVKAMRRLEEAGDTCWLCVDGTLGAGVTGQQLVGAHSTLLILP